MVAAASSVAATFAARAGETPPSPADETPAAADVLTLGEAVRLAQRDNRSLRNAELEVGKAEDQLASLRTRFLPEVDLTILGSHTLSDIRYEFPEGAFGDFPGIGPIPAEDTDVVSPSGTQTFVIGRLTQPLSQLRRVGLNVRLGELSLETARQQLRAQRQTVVSDVKRTYYDLLQTQSALRAAEESVAFLRELERVVDNLLAQRMTLKADSLEVKARLASEEHQALTLRNALESRQERLNDLLGREVGTAFSVIEVPEPSAPEVDLKAARARALERRTDLAAARLQQVQTDVQRRLRRWDYVPDVSLSVNYITSYDVEVLPRDFTSIGLMLTWEPLDWGRRGRALDEARRADEQAAHATAQAESLAAIDVGARFRALQEARALLDVSRLAQEAARERLNVTMEKFNRKAALLKDVLEDQQNLADANRGRQQALATAWTARADFEKAIGEDD